MKRITFYSFILLLLMILTGCESGSIETTQVLEDNTVLKSSKSADISVAEVKLFSEALKLTYKVIDNVNAERCKNLVKSGLCFDAQIHLALEQPINLPNWKIYFSNMSPILMDDSELLDITHVNGDQHYISPTSKFKGWIGNQSLTVKFKAEFWHISEFDSPPNFYLVVDGFKPKIIDSTLAQIDSQTGQEFLPHMMSFAKKDVLFKRGKDDQSVWDTAEELFKTNQQNNEGLNDIAADVAQRIIPSPMHLTQNKAQGALDIRRGLLIEKNDFNIGLDSPAVKRLQQLGVTINHPQAVPVIFERIEHSRLSKKYKSLLAIDNSADPASQLNSLDASYFLDISVSRIKIRAFSKTGAFYALQSIAGLYKPGENQLSIVQVVDRPRYEYRGFFLDVARNFRNKEFIIKLLDQMAAYKLNRFHFHLGDDEGWRLEIPGLPELTSLGANRCHDPEESSCLSPQLGSGPFPNGNNDGFYSIQDYQEILAAATERHIEVIPSFDMPGHSRAAVKSMQLRYKNYIESGDKELAEEFLLSDLNDKTRYSSVQFYNDNTLNVCKESTYRFVEKVLNEVIDFHQNASHPLKTYHIGADETAGAWNDSPECQVFMAENNLSVEQLTGHFIQRVSKFLAAKAIRPGGWSDGLSLVSAGEMPEDVHVNVWTPLFWEGHKVAHNMANKDWRVVLSMPDVTYFDFPYQADPKERGYYWGARKTNTRQIFEWMPDNLPIHAEIWNDRINQSFVSDDRASKATAENKAHVPMVNSKGYHGIQAQLWSEMVRSDSIAEYLIFPRLIALAERAWHKPQWEVEYDNNGQLFNQQTDHFSESLRFKRDRDWLTFAKTIADKEMTKLDLGGIAYRLPTAGAKLSNNKLFVNSAFPGLPLQYKIGNGEWQLFVNAPHGVEVTTSENIFVRTTNPSGSRVGRHLMINNN